MIKRSQNKWISHQRITDKGEINLLCFVFAGGVLASLPHGKIVSLNGLISYLCYIHKEKEGLAKICLTPWKN